MSALLNSLLALLTLCYPLAVYFGIQYFQPRWLALSLALVLILRLLKLKLACFRWIILISLFYLLLAFWSNQIISLRFYPVIVNLAMLLGFSYSLLYPPSLIERLARLTQPQLPSKAIGYTRRVTQVWCGFFCLNGSLALYSALYSSFEIWTLYNGCLAYVLMGLLFAGEYLYRRRIQAKEP